MLVFAMGFAAYVGVLQLAVLGTFTRTVRLSSLYKAVGVGMYGCGAMVLLAQVLYVKVMSLLSDASAKEIQQTAAHTINPFIEESVKILPLVCLGLFAATRKKRGLTDYTLLGASFGAGFGLIESLMNFGTVHNFIVDLPKGWGIVYGSLDLPFVPSPVTSITTWLPSPVTVESALELNQVAPSISYHLVWSMLAGFGIGVLFRVKGWQRWFGLLFLVFASADHMAFNYFFGVESKKGMGETAANVFATLRPFLWLLSLLIIVLAAVIDYRTLNRAKKMHGELLLAKDGSEPAWFIRYATFRFGWPAIALHRFVLARRSTFYALEAGLSTVGSGKQDLAQIRTQLQKAATEQKWQKVSIVKIVVSSNVKRLVLSCILWLFLVVPAVLYYSTKSAVAPTDNFRESLHSWLFYVMLAASFCGFLWLLAGSFFAVRSIWGWRKLTSDTAMSVLFRLWTSFGASAFGLVIVVSFLNGRSATDPIVSMNIFGAFSNLLFILGLALLLLGFMFFPPLSMMSLAGSSVWLVPTVSSQFIALELLGISSIVLSQTLDGDGYQNSASRGDAHGDGGRTHTKNQQRIQELEDELARLKRNQGPSKQKKKIEKTLERLKKVADRHKKGETHGRAARR